MLNKILKYLLKKHKLYDNQFKSSIWIYGNPVVALRARYLVS